MHAEKNSVLKYAYIENEILVNGKPCTLVLVIRKSPVKNLFWLHQIDIKNSSDSYSMHPEGKATEQQRITTGTNDTTTDKKSQDKRYLQTSADSITYDDEGNVIPISERFNSEKTDIRYSMQTDSEGNVLSEQQAEYFANSKVRDEAGKLLAMYHGTPNAGFTVFRSGTYFTQNKDYADLYQGRGASSLGYKKTAGNPDTYAVYLNITKPFDTRNKKERDIFRREYLGKWGMGTDLMESGLPDWMDGMDLQEFIEENGYDYDGLILDEGGVGGYEDTLWRPRR